MPLPTNTQGHDKIDNIMLSVIGTYGSGIIRIKYWRSVNSSYGGKELSNITVYYADGSSQEIARYDKNQSLPNIDISNSLSFRYTSGGKTFILNGLPGEQQTPGSGIIYQENGFLKIS
jgi:hypothetical protein